MKFYSKQPIEAEQFDGSQTSLFGYEVMPDSLLDALTGEPAYYSILIDDVESELDDFPDDNEVSFEVGDWIVKEANDIKVLADEEFKQQYAELPVIPKNVANYLTDCKLANTTIETSLSGNIMLFSRARSHDMIHDILSWLCPSDNQDLFARAWLDGYRVEEGK
ncbi:DUF1642 domain-containing protein [Lactiplantibacillus plantarum]|uniref:DUF1642 domain-containing protein n=1 Tax=Lactiplantibacillus plantarum TaxID=1590 RepID=UPI001590BAF9|nr:DUF1642 domain-containing protein [Lactiplantibacillus plantarum]QKX09099.1 hypothetical protein Heal19_500493 [Lactiplantibacillus plantarum]